MSGGQGEAPEILTPEYYTRLEEVERRHWWCRSVRRVSLRLLTDGLRPDARVLDLGCGAGGFLAAFDAGVRAGVGLDPSADALRLARAKGLHRLVLASGTELPFRASSFDAVVSHDVLQHLPGGGDRDALREAWRVLCPGGRLSLRTNIGAPLVQAGSALHRRYDPDGLAALVREAGLTVERHLVLHPLAAALGRLRPRPTHGAHHHHGKAHGLAITVPPAPVNVALGLWSRLEDAFLLATGVRPARGDVQVILARRTDG